MNSSHITEGLNTGLLKKNLFLDKSLFFFLINLNVPSIPFVSQTKQHLCLPPIFSALKMV